MSKKEKYTNYFNELLTKQMTRLQDFNQSANQFSPGLPERDQAMRLYCLLYDRAPIPIEFWTFAATVPCFNKCLQTAQIDVSTDEQTLRSWATHLGLSLNLRPIVTAYSPQKGITGFDLDAFEIHGVPAPEELEKLQAKGS
jgi:hypothetical protein